MRGDLSHPARPSRRTGMSRPNLHKTHRLAMAAVLGLETYSRTHVEKGLYDLIKLRASRLNRCAYCIDMHTTALRKRGESEARIAALGGDLTGGLFTERELAALRLTDAETRLTEDGVSDEVWGAAERHFTSAELGDLVVAIATINVWNRIGVATKMEP